MHPGCLEPIFADFLFRFGAKSGQRAVAPWIDFLCFPGHHHLQHECPTRAWPCPRARPGGYGSRAWRRPAPQAPAPRRARCKRYTWQPSDGWLCSHGPLGVTARVCALTTQHWQKSDLDRKVRRADGRQALCSSFSFMAVKSSQVTVFGRFQGSACVSPEAFPGKGRGCRCIPSVSALSSTSPLPVSIANIPVLALLTSGPANQ